MIDASLQRDLAAIGPFFAVETHPPGRTSAPPWQPVGALTDGSDTLPKRVQAVRAVLAERNGRRPADVLERVAVSAVHLGLVARLLSPLIGAIALGHPPIDPTRESLWWQDVVGGPFPLSVTVGAQGLQLPGSAVHAVTEAVAARFPVSARVLWGNVGSAANSAARLVGIAYPQRADAARAAAGDVLADPRVDGGALRAGPHFRRRSCCLFYRLGEDRGAVCGDCVLG